MVLVESLEYVRGEISKVVVDFIIWKIYLFILGS